MTKKSPGSISACRIYTELSSKKAVAFLIWKKANRPLEIVLIPGGL